MKNQNDTNKTNTTGQFKPIEPAEINLATTLTLIGVALAIFSGGGHGTDAGGIAPDGTGFAHDYVAAIGGGSDPDWPGRWPDDGDVDDWRTAFRGTHATRRRDFDRTICAEHWRGIGHRHNGRGVSLEPAPRIGTR